MLIVHKKAADSGGLYRRGVEDGMIQTWITDVTPLLDGWMYQKYYDRLPRWRKEKADRIRRTEDKILSVGVWSLYQCMLEAYEPSEQAAYNLSHSGRYALCSMDTGRNGSATKVGCDVEMIKEFRPGIAKRFFCPDEELYILQQSDAEHRADAFYRYWVLKESFVKATRQGLKMDLRSFEIRIEDGKPRLVRQPEEYPEHYFYREYQVADRDARIAVCSTRPEFGEIQRAEIFSD